ncbi:DUF2339 domain-containing protein [Pseudonocardia xinjiangensis]|uniref:DUF2339 domain-containing protein n=1 Tax=Pseudonocardia xinjiangensis TaxID=75289 RepID=UPI003D8D0A71
MNTETVDPYVALAAEMSLLGRRLDAMSTDLVRLRAAAAPVGPGPAPAVEAPLWSRSRDARSVGRVASDIGPESPGDVDTSAAGPDRTAPSQVRAPVGAYAPGPPARGVSASGASTPGWPSVAGGPNPARTARARSAISGARLLAWVGGGVTLLGVVLLLVLAASRGWFSPPARVTTGALLGIALVGIGLWLHCRENARAGALALAATGLATLYLVVAAATVLYGYLPVVPALLVELLVAAAGLGLADRWRSQLLGAGVVAGAALLAPVIVADWRLVALALALQLAALPVVLRRRWHVLMLLAAAGPVLFGSAVGALVAVNEEAATIAVVLGALAVGLSTAVPAARLLPRGPVAGLVAATPVPVLATAAALGDWGGGAVAAVAALALGGFAMTPGLDHLLRTVGITAAAVALFEATLVAVDGSGATVLLLGQAVVLAVLAAVLRSRLPLNIAMAYGAVGSLLALAQDAPLAALVQFPAFPYHQGGRGVLLTGAGVSVLVLVLAVALLVAAGRVDLIRPDPASAPLWVPIGVVGLYGATSLVVTVALLLSPDRAGFTGGHAVATVSWTVAALVLLARGISRPALRITGLVLVAAAVAKLVLFDLVALDGLARVAAFLGAGLVLLAAGTRYARLVAEAEKEKEEPDGVPADPS